MLLEFQVEVEIYLGFVLSYFLFAVVVDVFTELSRDGVLSELAYADDFVLMDESTETQE